MVVLYRQLELTTNGSRSRTADITGNKTAPRRFSRRLLLVKTLAALGVMRGSSTSEKGLVH
jgi:hypothetical protein